jgi:DUF1680 family protein
MKRQRFDIARRQLVVAGVLAAGVAGLRAPRVRAQQPQASGVPGRKLRVEPLLRELRYGQVQLCAGPLQSQASANHRLLLGLDEDSLLRPFRIRAGMAAPGLDLGGWYDTYAFAPGATFGHWVSALARHYAITADEATQRKVHRLVHAFAETVEPEGKFYVNNRFPAYIYDKLVGALVDARTLADNELAVPTLARATTAAMPFLPPHAMPRNEHAAEPQDFTEHAWDESYTIPENQFYAYRLTGDPRHAQLATRFLYDDFFAPLARGENVLPGKHAYSHVNALSSAAQAYLSLGVPRYREAAKNGFAMLGEQSYATGGWGPDEHFIAPGSGALGASLKDMHKSFETPCGAYAHIKLCRYLLRMTRDSAYGDSMERVLYNTVLGALPLQADGRAFYYSDYAQNAAKVFHPDRWPCCSGTLPLVTADYSISTCFTDTGGIYVNLYVPAEITWQQGDVRATLRIATSYPYTDTVRMTLDLPAERRFAVHLRIPGWVQAAEVRVNGRRERGVLPSGTFAMLLRSWRPGDVIELELPQSLLLQAVDAEHPETVALLHGPLVLMRLLEPDESSGAAPTRVALLAATRPAHAGTEWQVSAGSRKLRLRAFPDINNERYSVYQDVASS